jgi:hypothetical protein
MAKQTGDYRITGTYDGVTYYQMEGQYYARAKSSLKGTRVKRDPRFKRTMEWAERLAVGSQLASKVYRSLPREAQVYTLFCTLKSAAIGALKEGKGLEEVKGLLKALVSTKDKGQSTKRKGKMGRVAVPCTLYAVWKDCAITRVVTDSGERLFVDASGRLKDCGAGSKQARAHGP